MSQSSHEETQQQESDQGLRQSAFVLLLSGQSVSTMGDAFFNLAVMWAVYTQSGSALLTASVQVIWQLSALLFGPLAGIVADRWNRKSIMWLSNLLSAIVVSVYAIILLLMGRGGQTPLLITLITVFVLNSLKTFFTPAHFSILPEVVGRRTLATAVGLYSTFRQIASLLGNALAGIVIALAGVAWSLFADVASFLFAALTTVLAPLPAHRHTSSAEERARLHLLSGIRAGWQVLTDQPTIRRLVWLGLLINVASFVGPLVPALITRQLHGGAEAYGLFEAAAIAGGITGGAIAGFAERRIGAGRLLCLGWTLAGTCTLAMAGSTILPLTIALEAIAAWGLTLSGVAIGVLTALLVPENYRGRIQGMTAALNVIAVPISALLGGWLADRIGPVTLFAIGGAWILGISVLGWFSPHLRGAHA